MSPFAFLGAGVGLKAGLRVDPSFVGPPIERVKVFACLAFFAITAFDSFGQNFVFHANSFSAPVSGSAETGRRSDLGPGAAMRERKAATRHVPIWTWRCRIRSNVLLSTNNEVAAPWKAKPEKSYVAVTGTSCLSCQVESRPRWSVAGGGVRCPLLPRTEVTQIA